MPFILIPLIAAILSSEEPYQSLRYPFALTALLGTVIWLVTFRTTFTDERTTATVQRVTVLGVRWSLAWWFHPMPLTIKGVSAPEAAAKTVAFSILARETYDSAARFRTTQQAVPIVHAALLGLIRYGQLIVVRRDTQMRGPLDWRDTEYQEYVAYPVEGAEVVWRGGALETTIMAALRRGTDPWRPTTSNEGVALWELIHDSIDQDRRRPGEWLVDLVQLRAVHDVHIWSSRDEFERFTRHMRLSHPSLFDVLERSIVRGIDSRLPKGGGE